jgi:hypothetical protein
MKTEAFSGTMENAYGKPLKSPLAFSGSYQAFETIEELKEKNEFPTDKEIIAFRNNQNKANERQKVMTQVLTDAGYEKPTLENDQQLQLRTLYKVYLAAKKTPAEARELASTTLGVDWVD